MSEEDIKAVARRFSEELISAGKEEVADELIDENYVNHNPIPGQQPGLAGFKRSLAGLRAALGDLEETIEDMIAEGDRVAIRASRKATHKGEFMGVAATGNRVTVSTMYVLRVVEGKVTEAWLNWDVHGLLQQLRPS